jgi:uncharacterized circularly permuted ATP-grasp superfamily protein
MLSDVIGHYHDLLGRGTLAADSHEQLDRETRLRDLYFGDRPVCTVLRPRFLTPDQFRYLQRRVKLLLSAFNKVLRLALTDATFRSQFGLSELEETLIASDPGFDEPSPTARLDSFFVSEQELKFTEHNAETPAGASYQDVLSEMFFALPVMQEFLRRYQVRPLPARAGVLRAILRTYERWRGSRSEPPRIGIIDWGDVPTVSEFRLFDAYFRSHAIESRILEPKDLVYSGGKLMADDYHVTLIYKRVLISELLEHGGLEHPMVRAVRDGAVCMVNGFRCKILYKKASFAVLSDERNARLFSDSELGAIAEHIPWTRRVAERQTTLDGKTIDLIPFVLANRDRFVLKPNDDYGGKGIVLGWDVDAATWERAVQTALRVPYVVQQRVNLPTEDFPSWHNGAVHIIPRTTDTNPYCVFGTDMDSCLTRISTEKLVNVTAGGGSTVPTFVVEER